MRVSVRHGFLALASAAIVLCIAPVTPVAAIAQDCCTPPPPPPPSCCNHGGGHTVNVPNINIHGGNINVGVNVSSRVNVTTNVTTNVDASSNATAGARAGAGAGAGAITYIGGGSYTPYTTAPAATAITGLNVAGLEREAEYEFREEQRSRWVEEWRLVRAVCVDDTGTPHPASRVDNGDRVAATFDGEVYRCVAGTAMQVTIGWRQDGQDNWTDAPTIMCRKGEALRHSPGGSLTCATQEPRRNCNERSLLRMYGPGAKLVFMRREEHYMESVRYERESETTRLTSMTLMLDGGVGGYR
ncbi:hypothetical protein [Maricaulis salignorans]|uniref:hypothetical protein n=1 Tax=Maricaulis salignorans TaxID=144026 RepID=UPI003A90B715